MSRPSNGRSKRLFSLDTNVLIEDPTAFWAFAEHDVYIALKVIEELDNLKKGVSEEARSARQATRFLCEIIGNASEKEIEEGLSLQPRDKKEPCDELTGKIFFESDKGRVGRLIKPDHSILIATLNARDREQFKNHKITLVTADANLQLKAVLRGCHVEPYISGQVLEDVSLLHHGHREVSDEFWKFGGDSIDSIVTPNGTRMTIHVEEIDKWYPNLCLLDSKEGKHYIVRNINQSSSTIDIETLTNYESHSNKGVWGIHARNPEQSFAFHLLMDPDIDFVSLVGIAGTGKTLLALAAALEQTVELDIYSKTIMTRATVPVGKEIGFLPGTEQEKMGAWMGGLEGNLEVLAETSASSKWRKEATDFSLKKYVDVNSMSFMRGATFRKRFFILDEAQNLTPNQVKTLVSRAGPGTKVVCLGNLSQIDTPYLTATSSGLLAAVERFKPWAHSGHIVLTKGERSRLADYINKVF